MSYSDFWFYPQTAAFMILLLLLQFLLRHRTEAANAVSKAVLLLYSYYILILYDYKYVLVLLAVTIVTYSFGLLIGRLPQEKKKAAAVVGVGLLLLALGFFKYLNFFADTICSVIGMSWTERNILLPLGISFYIFSAISYLLDIYWGVMEPENNFGNVALFLAFFPKIVCGPIVKGREFLPQLREYRKIEGKNFCDGIQIFVFGLFKKIVLADHIAVFVDDVYRAPAAFNTGTIWLAVFSYFLQLYFDFSGYSDMAIGLSKILGYDIGKNFNLPFVATTVSEFWNRWHISLGSWLNDYLFNPLAMSLKRGLAKKPKEIRKKYKNVPSYIAVIVTFLLSGLWHGAGGTYIVWGLILGVTSVLQQMYARFVKGKNFRWAVQKKKWLSVADILLCYVWVTLVEVFFRADSLGAAAEIYKLMFSSHVGISQPYTWSFFAYVILIVATVLAYRKTGKGAEVAGYYPIQDLTTIKGLTIFFSMCILTICMGYFGETYFVYGQF